MNWTLILLLILIGCNSHDSKLTSIQGLRDPSNLFPTITSISVPSNATYVDTNVLTFTVTFSEVVDVIGIPSLGIRTEQSILHANYISGTGSDTLTFSVTIPNGIGDANGVELVSPIYLNGGSIYDIDDDDDAKLTFAVPDTSGILINAYTPGLIANLAPANGTYKENAVMDFKVSFNFEVNVTGTPQLPFRISGTTYYADYIATADKKNLTFRYTVGPALYDAGIDVFIGTLNLNGGTIEDGFGDDAIIDLIPTSFNSVIVDSLRPFPSGTIVVPLDNKYFPTQIMQFEVSYNESVTVVSGTPRLALGFNAPATRYATYVSGSGTNTLIFQYVVQVTDNELVGGFGITYEQNGSVITDIPGNPQNNFSITSPSTLNVKADGIAPIVSGAPGFASGDYGTGTNLSFSITFNEIVYVSGGIPKIALDIGGVTKYATYVSGSGGSSLTFSYIIEPGLLDADNTGPTVVFPILPEGATIKDSTLAVGNNANLNRANLSFGFVNINSIRPLISSATVLTGEGSYKQFENIDFQVVFDDTVTVVGTPYLDLDISGTSVQANRISTTANSITFRYTVGAGLTSLEGMTFNSLDINLNGGSIKDSLNNEAVLTLPGAMATKRMYIVPPELEYWFDIGDSLSATVNGSNLLTNLNSKAETLTGVFSGSYPLVTDDGLSYLANFNDDSQFSYGLINTDYVIIVYNSPPTLASAYTRKLFTLGTSYMHLKTNASVGLGTCIGCAHYNGSSWVNTNFIGEEILGSYVWAPNTKKIVSLQIPATAANFKIGSDFHNGEIAEIIILNSAFAIPGSVLNDVHTYLMNKHGVGF